MYVSMYVAAIKKSNSAGLGELIKVLLDGSTDDDSNGKEKQDRQISSS